MVSWMNVMYRDQSARRRNMISILVDFPACTAWEDKLSRGTSSFFKYSLKKRSVLIKLLCVTKLLISSVCRTCFPKRRSLTNYSTWIKLTQILKAAVELKLLSWKNLGLTDSSALRPPEAPLLFRAGNILSVHFLSDHLISHEPFLRRVSVLPSRPSVTHGSLFLSQRAARKLIGWWL